jgi:hypothetical protein
VQQKEKVQLIINMKMKLSITTIVLSSLFTTFGIAQSNILDIKSFGGAPNADITMVRIIFCKN